MQNLSLGFLILFGTLALTGILSAIITIAALVLYERWNRRLDSGDADQAKTQLKKVQKTQKQLEKEQQRKAKQKVGLYEQEEQRIQEELAQKQDALRQQNVLQKALHSEESTSVEPESFLSRLKHGMEKTRSSLVGGLGDLILGKKEIDEDVLEELEALLIEADVGPETTERILESIHEKIDRGQSKDPKLLQRMLRDEIQSIMDQHASVADKTNHKPLVLLFVGVNGVGKTTTIGKLAAYYQSQGKKVLMGAGDTFRAAAIDQLVEWSQRCQCDIVTKPPESDPSAVMYATVEKAVNENYDVVLCDTAGRLHTKKNLMDELKKMVRVIQKLIPDAPHETFLVLDATTGQNAIFQTREFNEVADLSGLVVTKLDGTAKGGVVIGIVNEFNLPIRYIGIGESIDSLRPFDASHFTDSLFGSASDAS